MIIFLRHGQTASNRSGLLSGRQDVELHSNGVAQAKRAAQAIGQVDRIISSPLIRCQHTAHMLAEIQHRDIAIETDERAIELDYGEWDGRPIGDVTANEWETWRNDLDFAPPGGESYSQLGDRVRSLSIGIQRSIAEIQFGDGDRPAPEAGPQSNNTVVVVSHVSPIKAAVAWSLGVSDSITWKMFLDTASITRIGVRSDHVQLRTFNETGHLE